VETCQGTENTIYLRTEGRKGQGQVKDGERERVRTSYPQGNGVVPRVEGSEKERERVEQRKALEIGLDRHTCSHTHTPKKKKKEKKKRRAANRNRDESRAMAHARARGSARCLAERGCA